MQNIIDMATLLNLLRTTGTQNQAPPVSTYGQSSNAFPDGFVPLSPSPILQQTFRGLLLDLPEQMLNNSTLQPSQRSSAVLGKRKLEPSPTDVTNAHGSTAVAKPPTGQNTAKRQRCGCCYPDQVAILKPIVDKLGRRDFSEIEVNAAFEDASAFSGITMVLFWDFDSIHHHFSFQAKSPRSVFHILVGSNESAISRINQQIKYIQDDRLLVAYTSSSSAIAWCIISLAGVLDTKVDSQAAFVVVTDRRNYFVPVVSRLKTTRKHSYLANPKKLHSLNQSFEMLYNTMSEQLRNASVNPQLPPAPLHRAGPITGAKTTSSTHV